MIFHNDLRTFSGHGPIVCSFCVRVKYVQVFRDGILKFVLSSSTSFMPPMGLKMGTKCTMCVLSSSVEDERLLSRHDIQCTA